MRRFRLVGFAGVVGACVGLVATACSEDPQHRADDGVPEASVGPGPGKEAGTDDATALDASPDVSPQADADAGAAVTATTGSTGVVEIYEFAALGNFFEDDTILRAADAPDCVAYLRSSTKPHSNAGTLTIGGDAVGQPDGPPAPVVVTAGPDNAYEAPLDAPPFYFQPGTAMRVQLVTTGTATFGAMPVTTLHSAPFETVTVTKPLLPDAGANVVVKSNAPYEITWNQPSGGVGDAGAAGPRMIFDLEFIVKGARLGELRCSAPVKAGRAAFPASLLHELRTRISPTAPVGAFLRIRSGDQREVIVGTTSYVIELSILDTSTNFDEISTAQLD